MASFKEYQMMFQLSATTSAQFQSSFAGAQTQIAQLQGKIDSLNKAQGDITAYQKLQAAVDASKAKLGVLNDQYALLKSQIGENGEASDELKNKMLAKQLQIESTTASLNKQNVELQTLGNALDAAGVDTNDLTNESKRLGAEMAELRGQQDSAAESAANYGHNLQGAVDAMEATLIASGVKDGLKAISNAMQECAEAAITYETAMAGVKRTVGGSDSFLSGMSAEFKLLSTQIPITTEELAGIATTAGQLGVSQDYVMGFTETMAKLGTATDLTADQASTMLAQFANITGTTEYDRLGSVVADLGDATATTASKVVEMSQGMAAAASTAGMSETDIMAIAAAVGSLGIESQAGATSMSTLISTLYTAVETGDKLEDYAKVAGMTAEQFKTAWGRDAVSAMDTFIQGLNDTERNGKSAIVILDELGIKNVRQTKAILGLANADGLLNKTITQANKAWTQNTALTQKASVMYNTTEARLTKMRNAANNVKISIGEALTPVLGELADVATQLLQPISEFIAAHPELVQGVATFVGVAGGAITVVLGLAAAFKAASAAAVLLTPGIGQVVAIIAGAAGLTAGVVALVGALGDAEAGFDKFDEKYDSISKDIAERTAISDLISEYQSLYEELGLASESMSSLDGEHNVNVSITPITGDTIDADDFVTDGSVATIDGQANKDIAPGQFIKDGDAEIHGKPVEDIIGSDFVSDDKAALFGSPVKAITAGEFMTDTSALITGAPDIEHPVNPAELVSDDEVPVKLTLANLPELVQQAESLKEQLSGTGAQLSEAQQVLSDLETKNDELQLKLLSTNEKDEKLAYQKQMEDLAVQIETAKGNVDKLQTSYDGLNTEYLEAQGAVDELQAKEARLNEIGAELAAANANIITSTDATTDAFYRQVEAVETLNNMKLAELRSQAYDSIIDQAKEYANAVQNETIYQELLTEATAKYNDTLAIVDNGAQSAQEKLVNIYETLLAMADSDNFDWNSDQVQSYVNEVEELIRILYGEDYDFSGSGLAGMDYVVGEFVEHAKASSTAMGDALTEAQENVAKYEQAVSSAQGTQNTFLDNLVTGVRDGGMSIVYLEELLTEQFAGYENSAKLVSDAMDYVTKAIDGANDSTDGLSSGFASTAATALDLQNAISPIADEMAKLSEAYDKAYESALNSIDGQFDLFEKVNTIEISPRFVNTGDDSMREGLESQAKYMEDYVAMLEKAREIGVNSDLLADLADGTAESAEMLKRLVSDTTKPEDIEALNASYELVQQKKAEFASAVADIQTDFTDTMGELQSQMADTVSEMELSNEAADAAAATFQAMIAKANEMQPLVANAYKGVALAAQAAFAQQGLSFNINIPHYARGTSSAEPGLALVGENGPELIRFGGGEQVFPAEQTEAMMNRLEAMPLEALQISGTDEHGGTYEITFAPTYTISGNPNPADLEQLLREHDQSMREELESMLDEIESDRARRAYE